MRPTPSDDLDRAVAELSVVRSAWVGVSPSARIALVDELVGDVLAIADTWTDLCSRAEGLDPADPQSAEETLVGPYATIRYLRSLRRSLRDLERGDVPRIPGRVAALPDGRAVARIHPLDRWDAILTPGTVADVWMEPGVTPADLAASQAVAYRRPDAGGVCLVLGAGNVSSIAPLDVLYKLFVENRVVILKVHPVMDYLGPTLETALRSLVRGGWLRIVYGGASEGGYLCDHPSVDELHITGSDRTYETIVFGSGPDGEERRRRDEPILDKPFSAELGNVTPVIVVPGTWSVAELAHQADNIATMLTNNAGFNCGTARVIVTMAGWPGRGPLLDAVRARLTAIEPKVAYYPGAADRFATFMTAHPEAERFGGHHAERLPWAFIPGLDPEATDDPCYTTEAFCGIFGETSLAASSVAEFLDRAVDFANARLWGTLNATVIVHPATLRDPAAAAALERAIAGLRYGTVSVNQWSAIGFGLGVTPWGAYPGHRRTDIQSGTGWVHDSLMFSRVEKTVIRGPFRAWPKPIWFASHRTAHRLARRLVRFEAAPSLLRLPAIVVLALRG